ncbi:hypothetical protein Tneu_0109 [Pyrobaculum neutrophilum V24Sta]|uniref:Activator of aromatic catabolism domain-containing protein n=2 Tax=Pyrobaculum neutrophilum TaxID=70771 RepID=B1YA93_PYRNV|nr:hypothetical protein Tneu_0109 [Pyrobaculum neutrophilum V24Sta]
MDLLGALGKLLRGDLKLKPEEGVLEYRGQRLVALPASAIDAAVKEMEKYFGEAAVIVMERMGAAVGAAVRNALGWKTGEEALRELPQMAPLAGLGKIRVQGDRLEMENMPEDVDPAVLRYIAGFLEGLCIHVEEIGGGGHRAEAKVAPRPCP